jgi:hypothetical protein
VGCIVGRKINIEAEFLKKIRLYCEAFYAVPPDNFKADSLSFVILGIKSMSTDPRRHKFTSSFSSTNLAAVQSRVRAEMSLLAAVPWFEP